MSNQLPKNQRGTTATPGIAAEPEKTRPLFFLVITAVGPGGYQVLRNRRGQEFIVPSHAEPDVFILGAYLFPSVSGWLTAQIEALGTRAWDEASRLFARLASFVARAAAAAMVVIFAAIALLRKVGMGESLPGAVPRDLRHLLALLRSPTILAAGSGPALFIPRT